MDFPTARAFWLPFDSRKLYEKNFARALEEAKKKALSDQSSKIDPLHGIQPHDFMTEQEDHELYREQLAVAQREARIAHEKKCLYEKENSLLKDRIQCLEHQLAKKEKQDNNVILCFVILLFIVIIILAKLLF
jgi:hypothetical protein